MGWASLETAVCTGSTASRIDVPDHWCHEVILLHFKCQMIVVFCSHGSVLYSGVWDEKMLCKRTLRTAIFGRWHHLCQPEEISTAAWLHFLMSMFSPWFFNRPFNIRETVAAKNITEAHVSTAISHHWITAKQHDSMTPQSHPSRDPTCNVALETRRGSLEPWQARLQQPDGATVLCGGWLIFWQYIHVIYIQLVTLTWYERH